METFAIVGLMFLGWLAMLMGVGYVMDKLFPDEDDRETK